LPVTRYISLHPLSVQVKVEAANIVAADGLLQVVGVDGRLNLALDTVVGPVLDHLVTDGDRGVAPEPDQRTLDPDALVVLELVVALVGEAKVVGAGAGLVVDDLGVLVCREWLVYTS
jgi:hypothetical protein